MPSEVGLFRVFLGSEAGTADSLRRLGPGQTPGQNERALKIVNRLDLHACFNLLLLKNEFLRGLAARVRRDNDRFAAEAKGLVNRISRTSQPVARRSGMWQQDAAALLVSSLTLAATTSLAQNTHVSEKAAQPPSSFTTQMVVDPPPPPIENLANRQKAILHEKLLPDLAALLPVPAPLKVRIVFGERGQ